MLAQEQEHKAEFDRLMVQQRVRPTVLLPLWNVASFVLGHQYSLISSLQASTYAFCFGSVSCLDCFVLLVVCIVLLDILAVLCCLMFG